MQLRNATFIRQILLASLFLCANSLGLAITVQPQQLWAFSNHNAFAQPSSQRDLAWIYVLPTEQSNVILQTHTTDLQPFIDETGATTIAIETRFRLKNPSKSDASTLVQIKPASNLPQPVDLVITVDGKTPTLQPLDTGGYQLPVQLSAEARLDIELTYSLALDNSPLQRLVYDLAPLTAWQAPLSMRVNLALPDEIAQESWLRLLPTDWRYASDAATPTIKWLLDGTPLATPYTFYFVRSDLWQQIAQARQAVITGGATEAIQLGDLYQQLLTAALASNENALVASFYAQALAAYQAGLNSFATDPATSTELQTRLAQLYRTRIINEKGGVDSAYARLTMEAADIALASLPADDVRRAELARWRADGLSVLVDEARTRGDWNTAMQLLQELNKLMAENGDAQFVEQTRRQLLVQQALQLLDQGNRQAAVAVAGAEIGQAGLQPPAELLSLFASWQITVNVTGQATQLALIAQPVPEQAAQVEATLRALIDVWRARAGQQGIEANLAPLASTDPATNTTQTNRWQISLLIPPQAAAIALAEVTPPTPDWALLRAIFSQLGAQIDQQTSLFHQTTTLRQTIDLRSAAEQWQSAATNLQQRADAYEAQMANATSDDTAEARLRARIQGATYRDAARTWQNLVRNTSLIVTLGASNGVQDRSRTWSITPAAPQQTLEFQATTLNWGRVIGLLGLLGFALFLLTGALWWLL